MEGRRVLVVSHRGAMPAFDGKGRPVGPIDFVVSGVLANQYSLLDVDGVDEGDAGALARHLSGMAAPEAELPALIDEGEDGGEAHAHGDINEEEALGDEQGGDDDQEAAPPGRGLARALGVAIFTAASVAGVSALLPTGPEPEVAFALAVTAAAIALGLWFSLTG